MGLEPLDEARALQTLLEVHGTQEALAARLHRSQGWVSQRRALLNLTPELQRRLENSEEQAHLLRRVGNMKADEQEAALTKLKAKKQASKAALKSTKEPVRESGTTSEAHKNGPGEKISSDGDAHYAVIDGAEGAVETEAGRPQPLTGDAR